jgi:hypothetical protein
LVVVVVVVVLLLLLMIMMMLLQRAYLARAQARAIAAVPSIVVMVTGVPGDVDMP